VPSISRTRLRTASAGVMGDVPSLVKVAGFMLTGAGEGMIAQTLPLRSPFRHAISTSYLIISEGGVKARE